MSKEEQTKEENVSFDVLEFFGIKLKVSNKKLADLLTMSAKDALTEDIMELKRKIFVDEPEGAEEIAQVKTRSEIISQKDFEDNIHKLGEIIGFDIQMGEIWKSPIGVYIVIKPIIGISNLDKAKKLIKEVWENQNKLKNDNTGLIIVGDQIGCDIIKASIRAEGLYGSMRVISYENMLEILNMLNKGLIQHREIATLLIPLDNVDVGELINIVKAAASPSSLEDFLKRKE